MRNIRSISIMIRCIVSGLDTLLLLLLDIDIGELDKFLTFGVHPRVVLITIFIVNFIFICDLLTFKKIFLAYSTFSSFLF
jgi:hypothetical protein